MRVLASLMFLLMFVLATRPVAGAEREAAPMQVTVGGYVNDIQVVDLRTHSYVIDIYFWFRWQPGDVNPAKSFELKNIFEPDNHIQIMFYDPPKQMPDGSLYNLVRHQGAFSAKFLLANYPFDAQELRIHLEDTELGAQDLEFVRDAAGLTINPSVQLPGYEIGTPRIDIQPKAYPTTFGDLSEPDTAAYSRVTFVVPVSRPWLSGTFKTLVPVLLIMVSALLALLIHPDQVEGRIGLGITALLTLVALQFTAASDLPEVSYLMLTDKVFLASYVFILSILAVVVRGSWTADTLDSATAGKTDRRIGYLIVLLYVATLAAILLHAV